MAETHNPIDGDHLTEVTFHLGEPTSAEPYRWVGAITTPDDEWQHWPDGSPDLEPLTVRLPQEMSQNLVDFARRHIGPNATDKQVDYWCHTFAHEVGETALQIVGIAPYAAADAKARALFSQGSIIEAQDLGVGEHAVVGDANPNTTRKAPYHSVVGIGRPVGEDDGPALAVQVDTKRGNLYVGDPAQYLADAKQRGAHFANPPQPELYVQREPKDIPARQL